ncbi:MAG: ATP-dependent DNA helicase RecG [Lachnospiraceae bacterium]|nr:ATP-dependent DNA helicase RecG [Lachnospiraceae bacterium]
MPVSTALREITDLKGVGEKTASLFRKVGVCTYDDLLNYFPRNYVKFDDVIDIGDEDTGKIIAFSAYVARAALMRRSGRLTITSCPLKHGDMIINAVWFHMPYLSKSLKTGTRYIFWGKVYKKGNSYCTDQPLIFTPENFDEIKNTLQPVYPLTKGLTNQTVKKSVKTLFTDPDIKRKYELHRMMHFPKDMEELKKARGTFVYEEFFYYILRLRFLKEDNLRAKNDFNMIECAECERIIERLPYRLTSAQMRVWREIASDLTKSVSMNRLVQGDVGSGKTIIAFLSAIMTAINKHQAVIMAPTEILASQHFEALNRLVSENDLPVRSVLLTGSMTAAKKKETYRLISENEADIIIGTHALFQEKVIYNDLALVITDEQHRFGVKQRDALITKNTENVPHVLVMSATPIPRTLAIIMYGDLDISVIDEVPARRLPIKNCVVGDSYHESAYRFIKKETDNGHQAYVICPLVEESEGLDAKDVTGYTQVLSEKLGPSIRVECLHGKMKPAEKQRVMDAFYNNDIQVLVSTTVVEVGVNVPNATVMIVENAERFGLAQLHQLRGRIGRGDAQSYCVFFNGQDNEESRQRLDILAQSNDGFYIASKDLELRGPGELFGIRQSGELNFKLGDIYTDAPILKKACDDVDALLSEDRDLSLPKNAHIREKLEQMLEGYYSPGL